ncbi:MAG TPA: long-chain fatty acid--CoA ligase [Candidatus Aquilonibacter sp.]|nr:long-chain fatty acid--CoA ligase [Candidatus Aquilonibacter sp.]
MALTLASNLSEAALRYPERTALYLGAERVSFSELWEQARRYAAFLIERGIAPGDRVAILLLNTPDFPAAYYGALAAGAVVVPVHALLTADEIAYVLRDSGAKVLVGAPQLAAAGAAACAAAGVEWYEAVTPHTGPVAQSVLREPWDDAVILYTSGTTGRPKGAVLTHDNLVLNCTVAAHDLFELTADDVLLGALPLFHTFGQTCVMNAAFRVGASVVLVPRFEPEAALALMIDRGVTVLAGVPTMYIGLLDAAKVNAGRPPLRVCASGGAAIPVAVIERFEEAFNAPIFEGYGLSETSPIASFNQREFGRRPGTVGCGVWGVDVAVADAEIEDRIDLLPSGELGEIVIRGHCVFKGYLNNPEATREAIVDGWFRSGDLGTKDADGFVTIVDRKKDLIIRGGFNVYPREVEEVLMRHPAVKQVAVIGIPHATHGEEIVAVIVRDDAHGVQGEAIIAWSQEHLARHKYPRHVHFVDAMPLGPSGKVLKRVLRERVRAN